MIPVPYIDELRIKKAVKRIAIEIDREYRGKNPVLLVVLKGAFVFASDLVRQISIPYTIEFVRIHTYEGKESTGKVKIADLPVLKDRHVLIVEDIVDTGKTIDGLKSTLYSCEIKTVKICALLDKPCRRECECKVDFKGFTIPDMFVIGYGLDFNEQFRGFNDIKIMKE